MPLCYHQLYALGQSLRFRMRQTSTKSSFGQQSCPCTAILLYAIEGNGSAWLVCSPSFDSTRSTKACLIQIRHENSVSKHSKPTIVMHNNIGIPLSPSRTPSTKELPCLLRLLILAVSPQVERLFDPPQTSESLLATEDLNTLPARFEDYDVASILKMFDHGLCTLAGLGDRVLSARIAKKSNRQVGEQDAARVVS